MSLEEDMNAVTERLKWKDDDVVLINNYKHKARRGAVSSCTAEEIRAATRQITGGIGGLIGPRFRVVKPFISSDGILFPKGDL